MHNPAEKSRGLLEMIVAMIVMGTVGYFVLESHLAAHDVVFFRCVFGAFFLVFFCFARGFFRNTGLTRKSLLLAVLSGVFLVTNWVMLFASFDVASISTSTVIYHTQPLFFVLMGVIFLGETITRDKVAWILIAFIGVVLIVAPDMEEVSFTASHIQGVALAIGAAIFYVIVSIIVKRLKGIKPHLIAFIQVSVGAVMLAPLADVGAMPEFSGGQWSDLIILGAFHTCLSYILMYSAFQKLSTPLIAVLSYIYPVVAILVDYFAYGKAMSPVQIVGGLMILFTGYAVNQNLPFLVRAKSAVSTASSRPE
ncbi:DMT family transporter [Breoghania sp.]|uniref:DMT family transporter n=1 Tax=Breoghania sp. TaxID=2065378 RepID=UPI00263A21C8|nr:DMT family transporter [Breoghania sp.]MDJ0930706.1 DMT family transporter [Breoghania sp.]